MRTITLLVLFVLALGISCDAIAEDEVTKAAAQAAIEKAEFWDTLRPGAEAIAHNELSDDLEKKVLDDVDALAKRSYYAASKLASASRLNKDFRKAAHYYDQAARLAPDEKGKERAEMIGLLCRLMQSLEILEQ